MTRKRDLAQMVDKKLKKIAKPSRNDKLNAIIESVLQAGRLHSCVLADQNGLLLTEKLHKQVDREYVSAAIGLSAGFSDKMSEYLRIGKTKYNYVITNNTKVWTKNFELKETNEKLVLFLIKSNSITSNLDKTTLKLLGKKPVNMPQLMESAVSLLKVAFKD
jgi:predicted regulator of Ras-like GTPase activity (Roadblock/LC7/MglB family)